MQVKLMQVLDWLLPRVCVGCGFNSYDANLDLCLECKQQLPWLTNRCYQCGMSLLQPTEAIICDKCQSSSPPFTRLCGLFEYKPPINKLINHLKFGGHLYPAHLFGKLLIEKITSEWYREQPLPQVIIPVPLHQRRHRQRGYNQAAEICVPIAKALNIPLSVDFCLRKRNTSAQARLNRSQRTRNLATAFTVTAKDTYKHIALVDDVVTTGSTIRAVAKALLESGIENIDVWCVCKG